MTGRRWPPGVHRGRLAVSKETLLAETRNFGSQQSGKESFAQLQDTISYPNRVVARNALSVLPIALRLLSAPLSLRCAQSFSGKGSTLLALIIAISPYFIAVPSKPI